MMNQEGFLKMQLNFLLAKLVATPQCCHWQDRLGVFMFPNGAAEGKYVPVNIYQLKEIWTGRKKSEKLQ